jgi:FkbM family methyltransferase
MPFRVCAFHTDDEVYTGHAAEFEQSARNVGLEKLTINKIPAVKKWVAACAMKPLMVGRWLQETALDVVYVDVDARFEKYPTLFDDFKHDLGFHLKDGRELLSGTLYFRNCEIVRELVERWALNQLANPTVWDQVVLAGTLREFIPRGLNIGFLPPAYCLIFDSMAHHGGAVIRHLQASRTHPDKQHNNSVGGNSAEPLPVRVSGEAGKAQTVSIGSSSFKVPFHGFWQEFSMDWEPSTFEFFRANLVSGRDFLDIGAWVGPTAVLALTLGAQKVTAVEPNPVNFLHLLLLQSMNDLFTRLIAVNACVSNKRGALVVGPIEGVREASSATNIRSQSGGGVEVISVKLEDLFLDRDYSLIKIDIEGAEAGIIEDFSIFGEIDAAVWLSLHPPFIENKEAFVENLRKLGGQFFIVNSSNCILDFEILVERFSSNDPKPEWGTPWGNFFEIGLLPRKFFMQQVGVDRIVRLKSP